MTEGARSAAARWGSGVTGGSRQRVRGRPEKDLRRRVKIKKNSFGFAWFARVDGLRWTPGFTRWYRDRRCFGGASGEPFGPLLEGLPQREDPPKLGQRPGTPTSDISRFESRNWATRAQPATSGPWPPVLTGEALCKRRVARRIWRRKRYVAQRVLHLTVRTGLYPASGAQDYRPSDAHIHRAPARSKARTREPSSSSLPVETLLGWRRAELVVSSPVS